MDNLHYEKFADGTVKYIEDEIPFEIPKGWEWCRLRNIFTVCSSKRVMQTEWKTSGVPFYRAREIAKLSENGVVNNDLFISEGHYQRVKEIFGVPQAGDLMVTGVGTIGRVYIVKECDRFYYKDASVLCFQNRSGFVLPAFAKLMLDSSLLQKQIHSKTYGNTVDTITISTAENYICVLPPLQEQKKIVAVLLNALQLYGIINNECGNLSRSIDTFKSRILDLAIRGKLVPQDPNDEPASVLLKRIRAEKEELIKQGKIKRDKKESVIFKGEDNSYYEKIGNQVTCIDDEIPFEIPLNWDYIRLGTAWELISGRDLSSSEYNADRMGIPYITGASNFMDQKIEITRWTLFPQVITDIGDLLITCKGTIGEMAFNDFGEAHIARQIMAIRNRYGLNAKHLLLCLTSYINSIKNEAKGLIPGIAREDILNLLLPIPPMPYQNKVVKAVQTIWDVLFMIETCLR